MSSVLFNIFNYSILNLPLYFVGIWAEGRIRDFIHARLPSCSEISEEREQKFISPIYSWKV